MIARVRQSNFYWKIRHQHLVTTHIGTSSPRNKRIRWLTRYQNLIRLYYWQKVVKNQKVVIQNQNFSTKRQRIRVVTRYQNLIRFYYWQKVVDKNKKWLLKIRTSSDFITDKYSVTKTEKVVTQNQKFITKNQRIKVITRYQNLIKICYWQKVVKKPKK